MREKGWEQILKSVTYSAHPRLRKYKLEPHVKCFFKHETNLKPSQIDFIQRCERQFRDISISTVMAKHGYTLIEIRAESGLYA